MSKSLEKRLEFIKLRGLGDSFDSISAAIGVTKKTLIAWSKKYKQEILEVKGKALEYVIEEYDLAKSGRLKIIAEEIIRIDTELDKRGFTNISTSILIRMKLMALDVIGKILDANKVEIGGEVEIRGSANTYRTILREVMADKDYEAKLISQVLSMADGSANPELRIRYAQASALLSRIGSNEPKIIERYTKAKEELSRIELKNEEKKDDKDITNEG